MTDVRVDDDGRIAESVACRACGYDVRGLGVEQVCPECALPVERSIRGDLLQFDDPSWVARLARGSRWIVVALAVGIAFGVLMGIAFPLAIAGGTAVGVVTAMSAVVALGISAVLVTGVWWLTTPAPSAARESGVTARSLARWLILVELASTPLEYIWGARFGGWTGAGPGATASANLFMVVALAPSGVVLVAYLAGILHVRSLMRRVPAPTVASQLTVMVWGYGLSYGFALMYGIVIWTMMPGFTTGAMPAGGTFMFIAGGGCVTALGTWTFGIWSFVLCIIAMNRLNACARDAQRRWHEEPPAPGDIPDVAVVPPTERPAD